MILASACASTDKVDRKSVSLEEIELVKLGSSADSVQQILGKPTEVLRHDMMPGKVAWIYEETNPPRISTTLYFSDAGSLLAKIYELPYSSKFRIEDIEARYSVKLNPVPPVNCLAHSLKISPTSFTSKAGDVSASIDRKKYVTGISWETLEWRSVASNNPCPNGSFP